MFLLFLYAPMLWLSIIFSAVYALTGLCTAKAEDEEPADETTK